MATAFETEMGVLPEISKAVQEMDWILPTDIQGEAVPLILGGGDIIMAAETGSGKTGAFCLPVIQIVYETLKELENGGGSNSKIKNKPTMFSKPVHLNIFDRTASFAIDPNGMLCQSRDPNGWHGARATKGVRNSGKFYYEARVTDDGLCRVGWSTALACHDIGTDSDSYGFGGTGKKSHRRQFDDYGESFTLNDVIGCYLDLDNRTISWSKNGKRFPKAYDIPQSHVSAGLFPSVSLKNAELLLNFGESAFDYPPQDKFIALGSADAKNLVLTPHTTSKSTGSTVRGSKHPLALIMEPSRELAQQTYDQIILFKKHLNDPSPRVKLIIGGDSGRKDQDDSGVDIVVATPGRLDDMVSTGALSLSHCRFFILDECDGLLSAGNGQLIHRLYNKCPKVTPDGLHRLQMIVCSATLHSFEVKKLANQLMYFPQWVDLKGQDSVPETVHHVVCQVEPHQDTSWKQMLGSPVGHIPTDGVHMKDKLNVNYETPELLSEAVKLLKGKYVVRAIEQQKMDRALIFCRTKLDCDNIEQFFISLGGGPTKSHGQFSCVCLHSDRNPMERKANLQKFKDGEVNFLICTDVAARGIDITGLPYVINVTLPDEKQNYVHRIGRVGRAERMGLAISLVATCKEKVWYHANCASRGRGCFDTRLLNAGGCCIWYNERQLLGEIEEHLGVTIDTVSSDLLIPTNEFDGKVVYGEKLKNTAPTYQDHTDVMKVALKDLNRMEKATQISFLNLRYGNTLKC
nr:ATP dependent RNA helicase Ddx1 [Hymenolepis microstoma]